MATTDAPRDGNDVPAALFLISGSNREVAPGQIDQGTGRILTDSASGSGTVTSVSVVTANGFAGSVANATTTPAITLSTTVTGILSGNGTAISAASTTGSGAVVLANTPTLITPNIGAATGTSLSVSGALTSATSLVLEETGAGTDTITIQAPASIAASYTLTLPDTDGSSGEFLQTNGSGVLTWASPAGGGDVTGPGSSTDNAIARFDGTTGKIIQNSAVLIADTTGVISGTQGVTFSGSTSGTIALVPTAIAGTNTITLPASTGTVALTSDIPSNVVTAAATFATDESILRADGTSREAQATSTNATLTDAGAMTLASTATATAFIPTGSTATGNRVYLPAANTVGISTNGTGRIQIDTAALSPITTDAFALGSTSLMWSDLFLASGAVINFNNGNYTITHSAGLLTTNGNLSLTTSGVLTTGTIELGAASDTTLSRSAAGQLAVEGVDVITTSNTKTMTNKTISYTVEPASDDTMTGEVITGLNAGATIAQWEAVYLGSASKWLLTDADAASTAGGVMVGLATAAGTDTNPLTVALRGVIRNDGWTWATVGAPLYLSTTAGAITDTAPSGTDDVIRIIGYVLTDDCIYLNPSNDWITHT